MKNKFKKITYCTIFFQAVITMCSPVTQAGDTKIWSAAMCKPSIEAHHDGLEFHAYGIFNRSNEYRGVQCPITRDRVGNTTGVLNAMVHVRTREGVRTYCNLRETTHLVTSTQIVGKNLRGSGWIILNSTLSTPYGHRIIRCSIPPRSRITQIRYAETTLDSSD